MSCESDEIRQRQWADELWSLIQTSATLEEFAAKLLVYAKKLDAAVKGVAQGEDEAGELRPMNGGTHPSVDASRK